ncbi:MAG: hypothetical protein ACLS89_10560 [Collinsella sp.]
MVEDRATAASRVSRPAAVAAPDIVPPPQDVVDGCEVVLDTLFDLAAVRAGTEAVRR